ncbi:uncharacterized protein [Halyomorpha halys]|uniref:uncharacterized protein n=1 Tax=Halyomorpha halys TaxID=286706 RepID=UPI0034D17915
MAAIRPIVLYAAIVWWNKATTRKSQTWLGKLQRLACLMITRAISTTPSAAMEVLLNIKPLHIEIEAQALSSAYRLMKLGTNYHSLTYEGHVRLFRRMNEDGIQALHSDHQKKKYKNTYYSVRVDGSTSHKPCNGINCYTDGSLMEQGSRAGIWRMDRPNQSTSISLGKHTTVFQAEVFAINVCAQNLIKEGKRERLITIYTDSQAAIYALDNYATCSKLVEECSAERRKRLLTTIMRKCDAVARTRFLIFGKDRILDPKLCETVDPYKVSRFAKAIGLF